MTYNSYYCRSNTGTPAVSQTNTENFARVIKTLDADIVAIQELDKGALNRNKRDLLQEIADATGIDYQVIFAPAADYMGGKIGPGVLVKKDLGVQNVETVELPGDEGRMLIVVETPDFVFMGTHLDLNDDARRRSASFTTKCRTVTGNRCSSPATSTTPTDGRAAARPSPSSRANLRSRALPKELFPASPTKPSTTSCSTATTNRPR